jgi:hypothetical protein
VDSELDRTDFESGQTGAMLNKGFKNYDQRDFEYDSGISYAF